MSMQARIQRFVRREWEKVLLGAAALSVLLVLIFGLAAAMGWFHHEEIQQVRDMAARKVYDVHAYRYLGKEAPDSALGADHAFLVKPPEGWQSGVKPAMVVTIPLAPTARTMSMEDILAQLRDAIPASLLSARMLRPPPAVVPPVVEPPVEPPVQAPKIAKKPPPPPPPPRYLTYQGTIRTTEGRIFALMTEENTADGTHRSVYANPGTQFADGQLRLDSFSEDSIRCRTAAGTIITIPLGQKQRIR